MARIIPLNCDRHAEAQALLPWYATGQLDADEQARVEAHLAGCADCQAELALERRLRAEIAALPLEAEPGWARLRRRIGTADSPAARLGRRLAAAMGQVRWRTGLGLALAAQAFLLVAGLIAMLLPEAEPAAYRALGRTTAPAAANAVVIFRPDTTEADLRQTLRDSDAQLVGGPTSADAYVLAIPVRERDAALARLRGRSDVLMAEPIDAGASP